MSTTVSIAVCTYNGAEFLQQQLDSLANQTIIPDEIIICDDDSNDLSVIIAQSFAQQHRDIKVKVVQNAQNLGYIKNFEKAISLCTQDIIFLCDQDDFWQPEKIERTIAVFEAELDVGLVLHNFCWIDENNQPYPGPIDTYGPQKISAEQLPHEIKANSIAVFMQPYPRAWCGCMMAFRRSFNNIVMPIFPGKGHDDWILKILGPITETRFIADALVGYRMHEHNTNRRDLDKKTLGYLLKRLVKNVTHLFKGYTKRNFYKKIITKIYSSKNVQIKHPKLLDLYKKYT